MFNLNGVLCESAKSIILKKQIAPKAQLRSNDSTPSEMKHNEKKRKSKQKQCCNLPISPANSSCLKQKKSLINFASKKSSLDQAFWTSVSIQIGITEVNSCTQISRIMIYWKTKKKYINIYLAILYLVTVR